MNLNFLLSAPI